MPGSGTSGPTLSAFERVRPPGHRARLPELTVIYSRDIPAQVIATAGDATARTQLSDRFLTAIDSAAMKAGLVGVDAYLDEWRRETSSCGDDVEREVAEQVERIETSFTTDVLRRLARAGGQADVGDSSVL